MHALGVSKQKLCINQLYSLLCHFFFFFGVKHWCHNEQKQTASPSVMPRQMLQISLFTISSPHTQTLSRERMAPQHTLPLVFKFYQVWCSTHTNTLPHLSFTSPPIPTSCISLLQLSVDPSELSFTHLAPSLLLSLHLPPLALSLLQEKGQLSPGDSLACQKDREEKKEEEEWWSTACIRPA